ncbi:hypothetical protein EW145_g3794, partial [Phellinidium pouzarii]
FFADEVEDDLIRRAGKVVVDSKEACRVEAGELIKANIGIEGMVEIGEAIEQDGKDIPEVLRRIRAAGDVTIFKSVGIGPQDTAIAAAVLEKGILMGLGKYISTYD